MPSLLHIIPYRIVPPRGGGALRCFHLLRQLARFHDVHAIVFQREEELRAGVDGYKVPDNVHLYSPLDIPPPRTIFDRLPRRLGPGLHYRWLRRSWRGPAGAELLRSHHLIARILRETRIDAVLYEHVSTMSAAPLVKRLSPSTVQILDAHNVDHLLIKQEIASAAGPSPTRRQRQSLANVRWTEHNLGRFVDTFFACSDTDRESLAACSGLPGYTVPNGVDTRAFPYDANTAKSSSPHILFSGLMSTKANHDALLWLRDEIWPAIHAARSDLRLLLVGKGMAPELAKDLGRMPGVELVGEVPDMQPYFQKASVALVPLRIGSGTRLKILEAMSQGNPVVSTSKGAEGLGAASGQQLVLADSADALAQGVVKLMEDTATFHRLRHAARSWVAARYDWNVIGEGMKGAIEMAKGRETKRSAQKLAPI